MIFYAGVVLLLWGTEVISSSFPTFAISISTVLPYAAAIIVLSLTFHLGAFDLTMEAMRRGGTSVERNPITRWMFYHFGTNSVLWGTSIFIVALVLFMCLITPSYATLAEVACVIVGLNFIDWANDMIALWSANRLLSSRTSGIPVRGILPYPLEEAREQD